MADIKVRRCAKTGAIKYGTREQAHDELVRIGARHSHEIARCAYCRCLHVVEKKTPTRLAPPSPLVGGSSGYIYMDATRIVTTTPKALLVLVAGKEIWLPRSLIADGDQYHAGDENITIGVPEWFVARLKNAD